MAGVSVLIRDPAREVRGSQEQMLWERRRKAKDRVARERAKNLCCVLVGTAIVFVFMVVYISDEWLRATHPTLVRPESWPSPQAAATTSRAPTMDHLESTVAMKGTGGIKVHARGGVCCLRLTFNNEGGTRRSHTVASCDGPMPHAPYQKITIAELGTLLGALSRDSE
jgi:hypothetical protein